MPATLCMADFDLPTRSASGFLIRYILPRLGPAPLYGMFNRRLPFQLSAPQSDVIIGMGHGQEDAFTGQNEILLLKVGQYNPKEVEGKVVKLLSCQTGVELGPDLVANGCVAYLGYTDDYLWVCDADLAPTPWADEMAATCLMPVIDGVNALLDGKTAEEACCIELEGYSRNAEAEEDELIKSCIEFNMDNAVLLGNPGARVRPRPKIMLPIPPPPIFIPVGE
ncbi:hypothetical protein ES703_100901 [subsurface metagenome]